MFKMVLFAGFLGLAASAGYLFLNEGWAGLIGPDEDCEVEQVDASEPSEPDAPRAAAPLVDKDWEIEYTYGKDKSRRKGSVRPDKKTAKKSTPQRSSSFSSRNKWPSLPGKS